MSINLEELSLKAGIEQAHHTCLVIRGEMSDVFQGGCEDNEDFLVDPPPSVNQIADDKDLSKFLDSLTKKSEGFYDLFDLPDED